MRFIHTIVFLSLLAVLSSCEKVIDLNLKESDTKYVVEGIITNEPGSCKVYLSRTNSFYQDNNFRMVSGATVTIKDNGAEIILAESAPGVYTKSSITGIPGRVYNLSVSINNEFFTSTCTMPQPVLMDTLYISPGPFNQFAFATVAFTDPAGINNAYRFVQYLNGRKDPEVFWENDEFTDGLQSVIQLDTGIDEKDDPRNINSGDEVLIEMQCIDERVYKYWNSLNSGGADGSGNTAAPANPLTNIKGGALGYFSAHTVDRKMVIAP